MAMTVRKENRFALTYEWTVEYKARSGKLVRHTYKRTLSAMASQEAAQRKVDKMKASKGHVDIKYTITPVVVEVGYGWL